MVDMDSELILENHRLTQRSIALSQLEYAIFEEYSKVASANETWVDPVQAVGWMSREIEQLRQRIASIEDHITQAMQGIECAYGDEYLWPPAVLAVHTRLAVARCVIESHDSTED